MVLEALIDAGGSARSEHLSPIDSRNSWGDDRENNDNDNHDMTTAR